jgi:hypothetical protein
MFGKERDGKGETTVLWMRLDLLLTASETSSSS